jgi:hypothetical protein
MVLVNQTILMGAGAATDSASTVTVTRDDVGGRCLISGFEPV